MSKQLLSILKLLLTASILSLFLINTVLAYKPPRKPSRPRTTTSHGTRNDSICLQNPESRLTILAPVGHIGETVSKEPIFTWFVPDSKPRTMEFSIYEYADNKRGKKLKSFNIKSKPKTLMKFSPSQEGFNFDEGTTYLWQIALLCDRNNPKNDIFAEAVIRIVPKPSQIISKVSQTTDSLQRAQVYADAGYWYDAFSEIPDNPQGEAFKSKMLGILSKLETQAASEIKVETSDNVMEERQKSYLEAQASGLEELSKMLSPKILNPKILNKSNNK